MNTAAEGVNPLRALEGSQFKEGGELGRSTTGSRGRGVSGPPGQGGGLNAD